MREVGDLAAGISGTHALEGAVEGARVGLHSSGGERSQRREGARGQAAQQCAGGVCEGRHLGDVVVQSDGMDEVVRNLRLDASASWVDFRG